HAHARGAGTVHAQLHRGGIAQVDDAAVVERSAVIDAYHHRLPVAEVGHARVAGQRQRLVRCRERVHVVHLQARGAAAVELAAVVGGDADLVVALGAVAHVVALAEYLVGRAVAVLRARLGAHFRLRDQVHVGDAAFRRAVLYARGVQAAGDVVAALGKVFLRRRIRRAARRVAALASGAVVLDHHLGP